jgi:hypothetical protein
LISIICTSMMINQMMHGFWYKWTRLLSTAIMYMSSWEAIHEKCRGEDNHGNFCILQNSSTKHA